MEQTLNLMDRLASSQNRRDEVPNQELAREIAQREDRASVAELIDLLHNGKKAVQQDCIKVLYEIGETQPGLIAGYTMDFLGLLTSSNNRLQWGGMTALSCIAPLQPDVIFPHLPTILDAAKAGSVITRDRAVHLLVSLCATPDLSEYALTLLREQLLISPEGQFPMYAEMALPVIPESRKADFIDAINYRLQDLEKESRRKRVEKVIRRLEK